VVGGDVVSAVEAPDVVCRAVEGVLIADAVRSPLGQCGPGGSLAGVHPSLLAQVAWALLDRAQLEPAVVTNALIAGGAGFEDVARETCSLIGVRPVPVGPGNTEQSVIHTAVRAVGRDDVVLVLGTAKPSPAPVVPGRLSRRGISAELVASWSELGRAEVDAYAQQSRRRAREVAAMGEFGPEIVPAVVWSTQERSVIKVDETIGGDVAPDDGAPLFYDPAIADRYPEIGWRLHAGNVSQRVMGAAAAILVGDGRAAELGLRPRAQILGLAECEHVPGLRVSGPVRAARAVLNHTGIDPDDLDHYEISEVFPSIPLAWQREFDADFDRLNPRGGAIGLGRPGPASGLRSLATTLSALGATGGRLGILASEGLGSAGDALLLEMLPRVAASWPLDRGGSCARRAS
jgi:acetyl-CoA acyltransferase